MPEHTHTFLNTAFGIQPTQDPLWLRPLILGDNLFTYVAHLLPGYGKPFSLPEDLIGDIEITIYTLNGEAIFATKDRSVRLVPHTAIHIPAGETFTLANTSDIVCSLYVATTPSPWGPSSPTENLRSIGDIDTLLDWFQSSGHKILSPTELNEIAGNLAVLPRSRTDLDNAFKTSQTGERTGDAYPWIALWDAEGYRHGHDPHPPDDFWFRPVVSGLKHLTYIGQIPPGGGVPPSPGEAAHVEMAIYSLGGDLVCIIADMEGNEKERFAIPPHQAVYAPLNVPLGFWNDGDQPASFALTFTPTRPERVTVPGFRKWATTVREWEVVPIDFLNDMLGSTLWD